MNTDTNNNIFMKIPEYSNTNSSSLSKYEVMESIPHNHYKEKNENLAIDHTEWRWRIFNFPHKKNDVIEISFKKPNEKRIYINNKGEWVERNIGPEIDEFVIDEFYVYSD